MHASTPYANCDIAIYDGIYGIDLIVHLLVNDVGQGNDVAVPHWSSMSILVSILYIKFEHMPNAWSPYSNCDILIYEGDDVTDLNTRWKYLAYFSKYIRK